MVQGKSRQALTMRIQIKFSKQGALRYTGHLDLHKLWERAARRAKLPLAYSKGFHPQPKMNLASALPLGFSSTCEIIDMRLEAEIPLNELVLNLNNTMPEGIRVLEVIEVDDRAPALQTQVVSTEYVVWKPESGFEPDLKLKIQDLLMATSIPRTRRGKNYDLRSLVHEINFVEENSTIYMKLSSKEGATGRPEEVLDTLNIPFDETRIERVRINFN